MKNQIVSPAISASGIAPGLIGICPCCAEQYKASKGVPTFEYWCHKERIGQVVALCPACAKKFNISTDAQASLMVNAAADRIAQSYEAGGVVFHHVPSLIYDLFGEDFHRAYAYWEFEIPNDIVERINSGEHTHRRMPLSHPPKWPDEALNNYEMECDLARVTDPKSGYEFLLLKVKKATI